MATRRPTSRPNTSDPVTIGAGQAVDDLTDLRQMLTDAGAPDHIVGLLDGATDPEQIVRELVAAGVLPHPDDALAELLAGWAPLLERGADPLSAEIAGLRFLAAVRAAEDDPDGVNAILTALVTQAREHGGAAALAMLRSLASIGPAEVRPEATEAANSLVAAGLKDRPWVAKLGAPRLGACFGYADHATGAQEAIAVTFRYGRRDHALVALIDHDLGGGVKDCWPTEDPGQVRAEYRWAAKSFGLRFRDYEPAEARAILDRALERPACPAQPDQVEDVEIYLDLLRQRAALLPTGDPAATSATGSGRRPQQRQSSTSQSVQRVKVTLRGSKPPIWRRLEVPSTITLEKLHLVIQAAFGWENYHLWVFDAGSGRYGLPDRELEIRSAAAKRLKDVAPRRGDRLSYTYDFGDNWVHDLLVEEVLTAEPEFTYPRCVTGRRAGPPEDCGGMWGYEELIDVLADPAHPEHADRLEWLGLTSAAQFDPARFDLDDIRQAPGLTS